MAFNAINVRNRSKHPLPDLRALIEALIDNEWHQMVWIPERKELMYTRGEKIYQKIQLKDEEDLKYQVRYENWKI